MKLTRLRLLGFKSFVEPTDFLIEPGLTGVVGPNGCGKSNLVEALRWVMGETSHKSMRAADMDDVIFSGSNSRPARNNAEVAIAIDNADALGAGRLQRPRDAGNRPPHRARAGSTYRINGREVRARDVQILFADASTGSRSPALVHQGRIGEIIQAKPEQRRRVLEEAAGVAGLHARRHEAELRLKAAETNLLRVEDVIGQLAAQIDGAEEAGAPGDPLSHRVVAGAQGRGDALPSALDGREAEVTEAEHAKDSACARSPNASARKPRLQASGARRRRAAGIARSRGARRRGAAPSQCRAAGSRPRRSARQGPHRRTRSAARAICRRHRTRARARGRRRSGDRAAGSRGRDHSRAKRGRAPAAAAASTPRWRRPMANFGAAEKIFSDLTTALADLTAQRNRFENAAREQSERIAQDFVARSSDRA